MLPPFRVSCTRLEANTTMATQQPTPQAMQQTMAEAMDASIAITAKLFGLPEETVRKIVQVGMPMMAKMAVEDPTTLKQLYALSLAMMAQSLPAFYGNLGAPDQAQQTLRNDFSRIYGAQAPALTRDVASRAGASDDQVGNVLAGTMPAMAFALGQQKPRQTQANFSSTLAGFIEQASGEYPTVIGRAPQEGKVLVWAYFDSLDGAATALAGLQDSPQARLIDVENTAVIEKDAAGKVQLSESADRGGWQGLKRGVGLGGLLGAVIPALAIVPAAAAAAGTGGFIARLRDTGFDDDELRQAAEEMAPNSSALVSLVDPENANGVQNRISKSAKRIRNISLTKTGVNLLQRIRG
jgi:uncharacterized membrane protein